MRGSLPAPGAKTRRYGGNTPCVEVRCGSRLIILDAGSGLRGLGDRLQRSGRPVVADVLLSHYHYDHLQGLPFFTPLFEPEKRFTFHGPRRQGRSVQDALEGQMVPPYFPVTLDQVAKARLDFRTVERGAPMALGEVRVRSAELDHPGGNFGYRLDFRGRSLVRHRRRAHRAAHGEPGGAGPRRGRPLHDAMYTAPSTSSARAGVTAPGTGDGHRPSRRGWGWVLFHRDPGRDDRGWRRWSSRCASVAGHDRRP